MEHSSPSIWFEKSDINIASPFEVQHLYGYVLPHASTKYTGHILSHSLHFKPKRHFTNVVLMYYPSSDKENIVIGDKKYFHEYYVPWQSFLCALNHWNMEESKITFIPINVRDLKKSKDFFKMGSLLKRKNTLFILSVDFSHHMPFKRAIESENVAAQALMFQNLAPKFVQNIVDDPHTFSFFFKYMPNFLTLQWVGRTRSPGEDAVGYLSFLILQQHKVQKMVNGIFVTCYDANMKHRECLGEWFNSKKPYSPKIENQLVNKVLTLGKKTSRLTGGQFKEVPILYYTVSYLYKSSLKNFVRGWHTLTANASYLSEVFLENTFNNGHWIDFSKDNQWQPGNDFNMLETLRMLNQKAGLSPDAKTSETYYDTYVKNVVLTSATYGGKTMKKHSKRNAMTKKRKN